MLTLDSKPKPNASVQGRQLENEAVLVLECASVIEANEIIETLPFVQAKLITFELIPLKAYSGFERLFATKRGAKF